MPIPLMILLGAILLQRIVELFIAKANRQWAMKHGGKEHGKEHYKWFIALHTLFFISIYFDASLFFDSWRPKAFIGLFIAFSILQLFRAWCILSLGKYWNTRVIIVPGHQLIAKGPYRFIKHPNYWVVLLELIILPLLFQAYITAVLFPILHLLLMKIRIPVEEKALKDSHEVLQL
ncbi:isoprenylcysteine carboxyl methyltransferase family protein [Thalassobacillus devorans]|uniref:isoprenylcysteine carboxyl methyltransferase family protein n=1 Tax=Thalassobacillus devorans TaxID=279813 RepID=UPI0004B3ACB2|nr:isoprenylcysteine carboxylmethyltransferase family protein [Thalassobacillus devorans]